MIHTLHKIKPLLVLLMLIITTLIVVNKITFRHSHKLFDGSIVVHSHPYSKANDTSPFKSHQHSKYEWIVGNNDRLIFFTHFITAIFFATFLLDIFLIRENVIINEVHLKHIQGRSPPHFS